MVTIPVKKVEAILEDVRTGDPIRRALRRHGVNPNTWYRACDADEELSKRYAQAKEAGLDTWADEILEIADDGTNDSYVDENGRERTDHDVVHRSKLRIDTRKWLLAKLMPRKYGERTVLAGDPEAPLSSPMIIIGGPDEDLDDPEAAAE